MEIIRKKYYNIIILSRNFRKENVNDKKMMMVIL